MLIISLCLYQLIRKLESQRKPMTFRWPHIALVAGMLLTISSFLFFGYDTRTYTFMLLTGIIISGIAFCLIIFRLDSVKSKLLWGLVVVFGIIAQWLSEAELIRLSYIILIKKNNEAFSKVNTILLLKESNATWVADSSLWKRNNISPDEGLRIRNLLLDRKVVSVRKDSSRIFYMTFSRIDITHGISYYYSMDKPKTGAHLTGNWYH